MAYDVKKVAVIVNGVFLTGYGDSDIYQYEKEEDDITPFKGADGECEYAESPDNSCMITLTLKHTSPSNAYLLGLAQNKTRISITIKDNNEHGQTISGEDGRIIKIPNSARGKEIGTREWQIHLPSHKITE